MNATPTATLVSALRVLSVEIQSPDGVANAVLAEAAERMTLMANLTARHIQEAKESHAKITLTTAQMADYANEIRAMREQIKRLEDWKELALSVEREWNANAIATMLGGKPGESQRRVIQREVPNLLARIKRLEEAIDTAISFCEFHGPVGATPDTAYLIAKNLRKAKEAKP